MMAEEIAVKKKHDKRVKRDLTRLHDVNTRSSRLKVRVSEDIDDLWAELEDSSDEDLDEDDDEADEDDYESSLDSSSDEGDNFRLGKGKRADPTYELASLKRANEKYDKLEEVVKNVRKMFRLQVSSSFTARAEKFDTLPTLYSSNV